MSNLIASIYFIQALFYASFGTQSIKSTTKCEQKNACIHEITANNKTDVPYTLAANYFVNNSYTCEQLTSLKIKTKAEFDEIFGAAPTMGDDGKPTTIDFAKQFVITVIAPITDKQTDISVNNLKLQNKEIILNYKFTEGKKQSYTIQPALILIVDNKYQGKLKTMATHITLDRHFSFRNKLLVFKILIL